MAAEDILNGRYRLEGRPVGRGGMGDVWLARDERLGRVVVAKLIRLDGDESDDDRIRRFNREARLTAQLDHPGVPAVYDMGRHDDRPYIVMQRVDGITIDDLLAEYAPLPIGWVAAIGAQISSVLMAAHAAGLIHRDIKPENVMLDRRGGVKVLDFGVAGVFGRNDISRITRTGQGIGTPPYMAPEQFTGDPSTPQTDLYGLGCMLYELLAETTPFVADKDFDLMNMHLATTPASLCGLRDDVPPALDDLVLAMLEKQPADRPANASAVYDGLVRFIGELPDLPGALAPSADPVRAYHALSGRLPIVVQTPEAPPGARPPVIDRTKIIRVLEEARDLAASQPDKAAQLLTGVIEPAADAFGKVDNEVVELRELHAQVLHDAKQFRASARVHRSLANDLAELHGKGDQRVLSHLRHAALAHVMLGEYSRARNQLTDLLQDYIRIHGPDHLAVLDLRDEIDRLGE